MTRYKKGVNIKRLAREEEKSEIYKNQLELLIKAIHDMKGITKEVSNLKTLAIIVSSALTTI